MALYGYGLGSTPAVAPTSALPMPVAAPTTTPAGGHWQGDLWITDANAAANAAPSNGSVTIAGGSSGLPPAPAGYRWDTQNGKPTLVPQTQTVTNAAGQTAEVQQAPPLQVGTDGTQFDNQGNVIASYGPDGQPSGGAVLGEKRQVDVAVMQPGQRIILENGFSQTRNDHGTLDLVYPDGKVRPGASAPPTVNADGTITPAATNAGGDLGHNVARNLDPAGIFDPNGSHVGGVLDPANVTGWDESNGGSGGLLGGGNLVTDASSGGGPLGAFGDAVGGLLGGGGGGGGAAVQPLVRDPLNYVYGRDPNYVENTRSRVLNSGTQTQDLLNNIGVDARALGTGYAGAMLDQGNATAAGMQPYATGAAAAGSDANDYLRSLEATEGPSAAQAQLDLATQQGIAVQQSQARSGRGFGQSANANSVAASNAAQITQQAGLQAAMLRAQEYADWKKRQAANTATGGGLSIEGNKVGGSLFATGQAGQADSYRSAAGVDTDAVKTQGDLVNKGYDATIKGESLADAATKGQADLGVAAEQGNTSVYGADRGVQINQDNNKAQTNAAIIGALGTGAAVLLSDEREKTDVHPAHGVADQLAEGARGYSYRYLDPRTPGAAPGQQTGPMAQNLARQPAMRGVVSAGADGRERVDTGRLSLVTASALSEVVDRLNHLESRGYRYGGQ